MATNCNVFVLKVTVVGTGDEVACDAIELTDRYHAKLLRFTQTWPRLVRRVYGRTFTTVGGHTQIIPISAEPQWHFREPVLLREKLWPDLLQPVIREREFRLGEQFHLKAEFKEATVEAFVMVTDVGDGVVELLAMEV